MLSTDHELPAEGRLHRVASGPKHTCGWQIEDVIQSPSIELGFGIATSHLSSPAIGPQATEYMRELIGLCFALTCAP